MDLCKYFNGNTKVDIRKKVEKDKMRPKIKLVYKIQTPGAISLLKVSYNLATKFLAANAYRRKQLCILMNSKDEKTSVAPEKALRPIGAHRVQWVTE